MPSLKAWNWLGQRIITMSNSTYGIGPDGIIRMATLPLNILVKISDDAEITTDLFFNKSQFFAFQPVIKTVTNLTEIVNKTLSDFEDLVDGRY